MTLTLGKPLWSTMSKLLLEMDLKPEQMVLPPEKLNDADRLVLDVLQEGRATPTLVRRILEDRGHEFSRQYVSQRIKRLTEHGHLENLYETGVYAIVRDPREKANAN